MARPMLCELPLKINVYDIDALGIVSNIVYVRWFEDLRMHLLDVYYPYNRLLEEKKSPVLSETQINYHYPLKIQDKPTGYIWMSDVNTSRWECSFEIKTDKKQIVSGYQRGYFFDTEKLRPVRIPEKFSELFNQERPD